MQYKDIKLIRPKELFGNKSTENLRNPNYDIGEFLPPLNKGYQEIARICLSSTLGDVIRIMAKKNKNNYQIKVVDEYETKFIEYKKVFNEIPTQGDIFNIIRDLNTEKNSNYYWIDIIEMNELKSINEIKDFMYIGSNIYPNLNELLIDFFKDNGYS